MINILILRYGIDLKKNLTIEPMIEPPYERLREERFHRDELGREEKEGDV